MIYFTDVDLFLGVAVLAGILIVLRQQKHNLWYLLFFSIFWIYLLFVVSVIVFPIVPGDTANVFKPSVNLVPFNFGTCNELPGACYREIAGNIQLTIPFGFGIPFLTRLKSKDFLWLAILTGLVLEGIQLAISFAFRSGFRAVDINDVILNAIGVWLGYGFFRIFGYLYLYTTRKFEVQPRFISAYIYDVLHRSIDR